jgi:ferredoxin-NADP reductase
MTTDPAPARYASRLRARREVAERTYLFEFEKPRGFDFRAGQFMDLTLVAPSSTDDQGDSRAFSIASSPGEARLTVTTRLRKSAFKHNLTSMPLGSEVAIVGPSGDLTLHEDSARPAILLAGGIGITPFRSIVRDAADRALLHRIFLFYANRRTEDAPFIEELQALECVNPKYSFIPTMTQPSTSTKAWSGETGRLDMAMLKRHVDDVRSPVYYIAGPPTMVRGLQSMLSAGGIDPASVRAEEFDGY